MSDPQVIFVGPFPQPVHGQSLATERLFGLLERKGIAVRRVDTGEGGKDKLAPLRRITRLIRSLSSVKEPSKFLYLSVNSGKGLYFTEKQARAGRKAGKSIVLHHHVYRYIGEHDPMMEKLAETAGPDAVHLANCDAMAGMLKERYPAVGRAIGYGNAGFVESALADLPINPMQDGKVVLGHMSNLTVDKGVGRAIAAFTAAHEAGVPVKLLLAGPYGDELAQGIVETALEAYPDDIEYLGPVYGQTKSDFFANIDIFLFPTQYKNEAGPIVLLEAMASGSPAVSTDQCCIPSMLSDGGGLSIAMHADDAVDQTVAFIKSYAGDPASFSGAARERYRTLLEEQGAREDELVAMFR